MRIGLLLLIFALLGCASKVVIPERKVASDAGQIKIGLIDHKRSTVQIFPAVAADDGLWYYFYVQLKDASGNYIDSDPRDIILKNHKGERLKFKYERLLVGRFYLTLEKTLDISSTQLDFYIQNRPLKEQFKLDMRHPDRTKSSITLVTKTENELVFRLRLADKLNQPVELPEKPEILLEGNGILSELKHVSEGVWEFSLNYPDENQIMYFSARAQGVYLANLLRYQHVATYQSY